MTCENSYVKNYPLCWS